MSGEIDKLLNVNISKLNIGGLVLLAGSIGIVWPTLFVAATKANARTRP